MKEARGGQLKCVPEEEEEEEFLNQRECELALLT